MTIEDQPTEILLSNLFSVRNTQYGRACFADKDIPKDTNILITDLPLGTVVLYEFRKEVCANCFKYIFGENCKIRPTKPKAFQKKNFQGAGLWFCSNQCRDEWSELDQNSKLTIAYEELLENYQIKAKIPVDHDDTKLEITRSYLEEFWNQMNIWEENIQSMKKTKLKNQLPYINEDEYTTVRFITSVLSNIYNSHNSSQIFKELQSNEYEKIHKFPILLKSQEVIYKFLRILLPDFLQPLLTTTTLRNILGREYGNSFGIWQLVEDGSKENKEFLGYSLYPEASFFNHSCRPNVKKTRTQNKMAFKTLDDIKKGQQLCIDYFYVLDDSYEKRQAVMAENWFFNCACERCLEDSSLQN